MSHIAWCEMGRSANIRVGPLHVIALDFWLDPKFLHGIKVGSIPRYPPLLNKKRSSHPLMICPPKGCVIMDQKIAIHKPNRALSPQKWPHVPDLKKGGCT